MKPAFTLLTALLIPACMSAYTVKYTYNGGGGITSRTLSDEIIKPHHNSPSVNNLGLESDELDITVNSDHITVLITSGRNDLCVDYVLSNMLGQTIKKGTLSDHVNTIDISGIPAGTYVVYFITTENLYSRKLTRS